MAGSKAQKTGKLNIFVCDLGFSAAKWKFGDKEGRFFSAIATDKRGHKVYGDEAMFSPTPSYLLSCEDLIDRYGEMCLAAVDQSGCDLPAEELHIVVGVPLEYYEAEQERKNGGNLGLLRKNLLDEGFGEATVLPQGLGGVYLWCSQNPNHKGNILGLDIGFSTIIMSLYSPQFKKIIYSATKYSHGVRRLGQEYLSPKIASLTPSRTLTPPALCMIMEKGVINYGMNKYDVTTQLEEAVGEYVEQTLREVASELRSNVGEAMDFDSILFFGGGARHINGRIDSGESSKNFVVMNEPELANARGFMMIAEENF